MKILGQLMALLLMLLVIPLFTVAACNVAISQTLLNPVTYRDALSNPMIFNDVLPVALPAAIAAGNEQPEEQPGIVKTLQAVIAALDEDTWREVTRAVVPPDWLKLQAEQFLNVMLSIAQGDYSVLNNPVELNELQQRLTGEAGQRAAELVIQNAPSCTVEQLAVLNATGSLYTGQDFPICQAEDPTLQAKSVGLIQGWLRLMASILPQETVTAGEFYGIEPANAELLYNLVKLDLQMLNLLYLCPVGLVALIVVCVVRTTRSFGRWIGITGILTGSVILLTLVLLQVAVISIIGDMYRPNNDAERFAAQIFVGLVRAAFAQSSGSLMLQGGLFLVIGFLLVALSFVLRSASEMLEAAGSVIITEDGEIISTASKQRAARRVRVVEED